MQLLTTLITIFTCARAISIQSEAEAEVEFGFGSIGDAVYSFDPYAAQGQERWMLEAYGMYVHRLEMQRA